ncbi:MAG: hypothetical protein JWR69_1176 [Pedosphaera sp.]|nr:hypothetical protein [Pedosphaera sp.]
MNTLTLEYGGTEKFLADWGYGPPQLTLLSQAPSTMTFPKVNGDPIADADVPYAGQVIIRWNRLPDFSGGTVIFRGRRTDYNGFAKPGSPSTVMVISDPWWDLQQITFQHYWKAWNGSALANFYYSRINLFQDISAGPGAPWAYLDISQQISQIITFAHTTCGANLQLGTVDPEWQMPLYPVKAITCADAMLICLRPVGNAVTFFDYTTDPPTLHCLQRPSCTAVTLPYAGTDGNGRAHESSEIKPLENLQMGADQDVVIQYQKSLTVDGVSKTILINDVWPLGGDGLNLGSIVVPIDLAASTITNTKAKVTSAAIDPTTTAFWSKKVPPLADAKVASLALVSTHVNNGTSDVAAGVSIKDEAGAYVSLSDFAYELVDGAVAPWMKLGSGAAVDSVAVTITAHMSYDVKSVAGGSFNHQKFEDQPHSVRIKLTNSPTATYETMTSYTEGDPVPAGLAQHLHESMEELQWEGQHVIKEKKIYAIITPGNVLNLSGGRTEWATMKAVITSVEIDFFAGRTTVSIGPEKHLGAPELVERLQIWRYRQLYTNLNVRNSGEPLS